MRAVFWTERAENDLAAIHAFIARNSPHFATIVVRRLLAGVRHASQFPESGRIVPEVEIATIREVIRPPYRIVYRLIRHDELHVLTVHHAARSFPADL